MITPTKPIPSTTPTVYVPRSQPCFPSCCPHTRTAEISTRPSSHAKKEQKYLSLTISKTQSVRIPPPKAPPSPPNDEQVQVEEDKMVFLQRIRQFRSDQKPVSICQKEVREVDRTLQSWGESREQSSNLSQMLSSLSNEMFSEMLVSATIRGRVVVSASLGSITEVKSDMEVSWPDAKTSCHDEI